MPLEIAKRLPKDDDSNEINQNMKIVVLFQSFQFFLFKVLNSSSYATKKSDLLSTQ
jgi:hypothetical protein